MPRHKHADVIIAWANGETVQQFNGEDGDTTYWVEWNNTCGIIPDFDHCKWRIKPKTVKREGWVNVYPSNAYTAYIGYVFETQEAADRNKDDGRQATIRIEWEEEV